MFITVMRDVLHVFKQFAMASKTKQKKKTIRVNIDNEGASGGKKN